MKQHPTTIFCIIFLCCATAYAGSFCSGAKELCVDASYQGSLATFTITSATKGWVAVALSKDGTMAGSDAMMVWRKADGTLGVSDNNQVGYSSSVLDAQQDVTGISISTAGSQTVYKISRKLDTADTKDIKMTPGTAQYWILAGANSIPNPTFARHAYKYVYKVDPLGSLSSNNGTAPDQIAVGGDSNSYSLLAGAHGSLMFVAWCILIPAAIIIAKSFKFLGPLWFRLHWGLAAFSVLLMVVSFIIIVTQVTDHFSSPHKVFGGLVMVISIFLQVPLGIYIDRMWSPDRKEVPLHDKLHAWLGRILTLFTIVAIYSGLNTYGAPLIIEAFWVVWVFLAIPLLAWAAWHFYGKNDTSHDPVVDSTSHTELNSRTATVL